MNKKNMIASSAMILLPIIAGLILWNRLPAEIATHFNFSGEPDGYSSKVFAVFFLPLFMLAIHLLCAFVSFKLDKSNQNINTAVANLVIWLCPAMSIFVSALIYSYALGYGFNVSSSCLLFLGLEFTVIGNYLPKCRQNHTIGIKIGWTLNDEDNWNKTHRFAGKLWVILGMIVIINELLNFSKLALPITALTAMLIVPIIYSGVLHYSKNR